MIKRLSKKDTTLILTVTILLILFVVFIIRPSIIGYGTYQQIKTTNYSVEDYGEDIQDLKSQILVSNTNLSACTTFNEKLLSELEKYIGSFVSCKGELDALHINFSLVMERYKEIIQGLTVELEKKNKEISSLEDENEEEINELIDEKDKEIIALKNEKDKEISALENEKDNEINDLELQYSLLAENLANNLCCKAKVDNPNIDYYTIENNKILCLEDGTLTISC